MEGKAGAGNLGGMVITDCAGLELSIVYRPRALDGRLFL